jgi:hypothetical protein
MALNADERKELEKQLSTQDGIDAHFAWMLEGRRRVQARIDQGLPPLPPPPPGLTPEMLLKALEYSRIFSEKVLKPQ